MKRLLMMVVVMFFLAGLSACSSSDSHPVPPPPTKLSGTVTDTTLTPVEGATVEIVGTNAKRTTDTSGRYEFKNLAARTDLKLKVTGPDASYFPTFAKANLTGYKPTVLDVYLTRAGNAPVPTVDATVGGVVTSSAFIGGSQTAAFELTANELEDSSGTLYAGTAGVYITPIDVGKPGAGMASYQVNLDNVFNALTASSAIYELFGSAALRVVDTGANELDLITASTSTLRFPIPASPAELRTSAPTQATMLYLNEDTGNWVEEGTADVDDPVNPRNYTGTISRPGIWRVGLKNTVADLTEISGLVAYNDGSPAAGVTVYVNGVDYAYQNQTTTNGNGRFTSLAREVGTVNIHFAVAANGAQWAYNEEFVNPTTVDVALPFAPPERNGVAMQTVIVDSRDTDVGQGPDVMGYITASGRTIFDPAAAADVTAVNIADFSFVANQIDAGNGLISLTPTESGSVIQEVVTGETFETLTVAPTTGYIPATPGDPSGFAINLEPGTATFPILVAVKNGQGDFAKVSIDSVTSLNAGNNAWQITFRHAFSLTSNF